MLVVIGILAAYEVIKTEIQIKNSKEIQNNEILNSVKKDVIDYYVKLNSLSEEDSIEVLKKINNIKFKESNLGKGLYGYWTKRGDVEYIIINEKLEDTLSYKSTLAHEIFHSLQEDCDGCRIQMKMDKKLIEEVKIYKKEKEHGILDWFKFKIHKSYLLSEHEIMSRVNSYILYGDLKEVEYYKRYTDILENIQICK